MGFMPKTMYLAKRRPGLSREQFRLRWRQHGALAMSQASWKASIVRYVQSDAFPALGGLLDASDEWDGVGMALHPSVEGRAIRMNATAERPPIWADEDQTFARRSPAVGLVARERLLRQGPRDGINAVRFLWRGKDLSPAQFHSHWAEKHAPLVLGTPALSGYVRRYVQNEPIESEPGKPWGLDCDGIEETWYESLDAMLRAHAEPAYAALIDADRARFVGRSLLVITTEVILYDVEDPSAVNGSVYPLAK